MQKFIRNHQWITRPNKYGISYFGMTDFLKDYLLRLDSINHQPYFKTNYGINFSTRISSFLDQVSNRTNLERSKLYANLNKVSLSEQIQYQRFCIKQDEPFSILKTVEYDVELTAPISMRVIQCNFEAAYNCQIYPADWLYKVQILDQERLYILNDQESYKRSKKIVPYEGMLI